MNIYRVVVYDNAYDPIDNPNSDPWACLVAAPNRNRAKYLGCRSGGLWPDVITENYKTSVVCTRRNIDIEEGGDIGYEGHDDWWEKE